MATPRVVVTKDLIRTAMNDPAVRAELRSLGRAVMDEVEREARAAGLIEFADGVRLETGQRPGTKSPEGLARPFARVLVASADALQQEYGDVGVEKQAILRRAAAAFS